MKNRSRVPIEHFRKVVLNLQFDCPVTSTEAKNEARNALAGLHWTEGEFSDATEFRIVGVTGLPKAQGFTLQKIEHTAVQRALDACLRCPDTALLMFGDKDTVKAAQRAQLKLNWTEKRESEGEAAPVRPEIR